MKKWDLYSKLFVVDRFFTIAIRKRESTDIIEEKNFFAEYIVPADRKKWCADPILVDAENKTYIFYETVIGDKGHIEVAEVLDDCSLSTPRIVLKDECHYSYPFVFCYKGTWFMIPESSAVSEVRLYRSMSFPEKWELCSVLLFEKAVDTTVFSQNDQLYLLTFFIQGVSEKVEPHAYKLTPFGRTFKLEEIPWKIFDKLQVRGAGPIFKVNSKLYRPAQISQEQRYGDGLVFYEIDITDDYQEKRVGEMMPTDLTVRGYYADGLHTYCRSKKFEAIDVRCCVVNYFKPVYKILSIFVFFK